MKVSLKTFQSVALLGGMDAAKVKAASAVICSIELSGMATLFHYRNQGEDLCRAVQLSQAQWVALKGHTLGQASEAQLLKRLEAMVHFLSIVHAQNLEAEKQQAAQVFTTQVKAMSKQMSEATKAQALAALTGTPGFSPAVQDFSKMPSMAGTILPHTEGPLPPVAGEAQATLDGVFPSGASLSVDYKKGTTITMLPPKKTPDQVALKTTEAIAAEKAVQPKPVPLTEATETMQPVCGTDSSSVYYTIALGEKVNMAIRYIEKTKTLSMRLEGTIKALSKTARIRLETMGWTVKNGGYMSVHYNDVERPLALQSVGATLTAILPEGIRKLEPDLDAALKGVA